MTTCNYGGHSYTPYCPPPGLGTLAVVRRLINRAGWMVAYRKPTQTLEEFWAEDAAGGHVWKLIGSFPKPRKNQSPL